jgi:DNA processing protein
MFLYCTPKTVMANRIHEDLIALNLIQGIGPASISRLVERFGSAEKVLGLKAGDIRSIDFLKKTQIEAIIKGPESSSVKAAIKTLRDANAYTVCLNDPEYPSLLKQISDPPVLLYIIGDINSVEPAAAIVGTRAPSHYGREISFSLARDLSLRGISVVSGLARGIDTQAHLGALEGISGTVAVLGSGLDKIYPPENRSLAERISASGAIITEYIPGTEPRPENFPRRNRIISGLSNCVIVVEATLNSGAMITARLAVEQGRTCMAVPGAVTNIRSKGPHSLIRQGAVLVESAEDIVAEIAPHLKAILKNNENEPGNQLLEFLSARPMSIDEVASELKADVSDVLRDLTMLELGGFISRIDGGRYSIRRKNG